MRSTALPTAGVIVLIGAAASAGDELLELPLHRLLDDAAGVGIARQRLGHLLGLLEADVRRQRRDLGIGYRLVDHWYVRGQRLVPRGPDILGPLDPDPLQSDDLRIA